MANVTGHGVAMTKALNPGAGLLGKLLNAQQDPRESPIGSLLTGLCSTALHAC